MLPKYLYHYTKLESFLSIWKSQTLLFSSSKTTNDIFERQKIIGANYAQLPIIGKPKTEQEVLRNFMRQLFKRIYEYRQISLAVASNSLPKGYDIPMMWGQYARWRKTKRSKWQDGVCIELDTEKLKLSKSTYNYKQVKYTNDLPTVDFDGFDFVKGSIDEFIKKHINDLFFKKHKSWSYEREFRIITNDTNVKFLSIDGAISGIYVPQYDSETMQAVEEAVGDDNLLWYLINSYAKGERRLSRFNVHEHREFEQGKKCNIPFTSILNQ